MSLPLIQVDCRKALGSLMNLSNDELHEIINNDDRIESILSTMEQAYLKDIQEEKERLLESNKRIAEQNLNREPELVEGRERVQELSNVGEELSKAVEEKNKEFREKSGDTALETTLALLQTAASETEEESEQIARNYLDKEFELDEFLDKFLVKRKLMHLRLVKAEKMAKILSRDPTLYGIPNYMNAPPVNINSQYFPGINPVPTNPPVNPSVPYPLGPLAMPMPAPPGPGGYFHQYY